MTATTLSRDARRFVALDGWRGICALFVALFHLFAVSHFDTRFLRHSHLFVDFFFVLSGFVVCHAYYDRVDDLRSAAGFVLRRFGRLWPLHVFMLFVVLLMNAAIAAIDHTTIFNAVDTPKSFVTNLLLIHSLGVHNRLTWNTPSWSISTEFYTYLVFAGLMLLARRRALPVFALTALIGLAVVASVSKKYLHTTYDYGIFRCLFGFFTGACMLFLSRRLHDWRSSAATMTALECLLVIATWWLVSTSGPWEFLAPPLFALVVLVFSREAGTISSLLTTAPLRHIGNWSYSIYMVHAVLVNLILRAALWIQTQTGQTLFQDYVVDGVLVAKQISLGNLWLTDLLSLAFIAVLLLLSSLTYRWIEVPARRWFNRLARDRVERAPAPIVPAPAQGT